MGLVYNDGIVTTRDFIHLLIDHRELLERGDDDADAVVDGVPQILGSFVLTDGLHRAQRMVKARNGLLQLCIQYRSVGHDNDTGKDGIIILVVQRGQTICRPCNGIGFARASGVLDQVVMTCTVLGNMSNQLSHNVKLVVAREYKSLLPDNLFRAVRLQLPAPVKPSGTTLEGFHLHSGNLLVTFLFLLRVLGPIHSIVIADTPFANQNRYIPPGMFEPHLQHLQVNPVTQRTVNRDKHFHRPNIGVNIQVNIFHLVSFEKFPP